MKPLTMYVLTAPVLGGLAVAVGCSALAGIVLPTRVTVTLVNNPPFHVDARVVLSHDENVLRPILIELGMPRVFLIEPGQSASFTQSCEALRAIVLEDANLAAGGPGLGPGVNTNVLRMGDDFDCGDEIVLPSHTPAPVCT